MTDAKEIAAYLNGMITEAYESESHSICEQMNQLPEFFVRKQLDNDSRVVKYSIDDYVGRRLLYIKVG